MAPNFLKIRRAAIKGVEYVLIASGCTLELYASDSSSSSFSSSSSTSSSSRLPPQYRMVHSWAQDCSLRGVDMKVQVSNPEKEKGNVELALLILLLCDDGEVSAIEFQVPSQRQKQTSLLKYEIAFDGGAISFISAQYTLVVAVVVIGIESYIVMQSESPDAPPFEIFKAKTTYPMDNPVRGYESKAREIIELVPASNKEELLAATFKNDWGYIIVRWLGVDITKNEEDGSNVYKMLIHWEMITRVTSLQLLPSVELDCVALVYNHKLMYMNIDGISNEVELEGLKKYGGFVAALSFIDAKYRVNNESDASRPSTALSVVSMKSELTTASAFDDSDDDHHHHHHDDGDDDDDDEVGKRPITAATREKYANKPKILIHLSSGETFIVGVDLEKKLVKSYNEIYMQSVAPRGDDRIIPYFRYIHIQHVGWRKVGKSKVVDCYWLLGVNNCFGIQFIRASTTVYDSSITRFCHNVFDRLTDVGVVLLPSGSSDLDATDTPNTEELQLATYYCINLEKPNSKVASLVSMRHGFSMIYQCQRARLLDSCMKINFEKSRRTWNENSDTSLMMSSRLPQPPSHQEKILLIMSSSYQNSSSLAILVRDSVSTDFMNVDISAVQSSSDPPGYGVIESEYTLAFNSISSHHSMQVSCSKLVAMSNLDCRRCPIEYDGKLYHDGLDLTTLLGDNSFNHIICKATIIFDPSLSFSCLVMAIRNAIHIFFLFAEDQNGIRIQRRSQYTTRESMEISACSSIITRSHSQLPSDEYAFTMIFSVWEDSCMLSKLTMNFSDDDHKPGRVICEEVYVQGDHSRDSRVTYIHLIPPTISSFYEESQSLSETLKCLYYNGDSISVISLTSNSPLIAQRVYTIKIPSGVKKINVRNFPPLLNDADVGVSYIQNAFIVEGFEEDFIVENTITSDGDEHWNTEKLQRFHDHIVGRTTTTYAVLPFTNLQYKNDVKENDNSSQFNDPVRRLMVLALHNENTNSAEYHCFESSFLLCTLGSCESYVIRKKKTQGQFVNAAVADELNELGSLASKKLLVFSRGQSPGKTWAELAKEAEPDTSLVVFDYKSFNCLKEIKVPHPDLPVLSSPSLVKTEDISANIPPRTTLAVFSNFTPPIPHSWDLGCTFCIWTGHRPYVDLDDNEDVKVKNEFTAYSLLPGSNELYHIGHLALYDIANDIREYITEQDIIDEQNEHAAQAGQDPQVVLERKRAERAKALRDPIGREAPKYQRKPFDPRAAYMGATMYPKTPSSFNPPSYCAVSWRSISIIEWTENFIDNEGDEGEDTAKLDIGIKKVQQITFPSEAVVISVRAVECFDLTGKTSFIIVVSRLSLGLFVYNYSQKSLQNVFNLPFAHGFVNQPFLRFSFSVDPMNVNDNDCERKFIILCLDRVLRYFYEIELIYSDLMPTDSQLAVSEDGIMKRMVTRKYDLTEEFLLSLKKVVCVLSRGQKEKTGILLTWLSTSGSLHVDQGMDVDCN